MDTTVIIPARNEESTIYDIVRTFQAHSRTYNNVYVGIDSATTDATTEKVLDAGGIPIPLTNVHGKGEVVAAVIKGLGNLNMLPRFVLLCDGDYTGLTTLHIDAILKNWRHGMTIGVPDWPECEVPEHVTNAWPRVSGFRYLPTWLIPKDAHGYLLETQINKAAGQMRYPVKTVLMPGLKAPFQWPLTPRRMAALRADQEWGLQHGIF